MGILEKHQMSSGLARTRAVAMAAFETPSAESTASWAPLGEETELRESIELSTLWQLLTTRAWVITGTANVGDACLTLLEERGGATSPLQPHTAILQRILLGESQKSVALDFGVSGSTIAATCVTCLRASKPEHRMSRAPSCWSRPRTRLLASCSTPSRTHTLSLCVRRVETRGRRCLEK